MLNSPLPEIVDHSRVFRSCVLNAVPVPERTRAILEARGVNTDALTTRLLESIGFQR